MGNVVFFCPSLMHFTKMHPILFANTSTNECKTEILSPLCILGRGERLLNTTKKLN